MPLHALRLLEAGDASPLHAITCVTSARSRRRLAVTCRYMPLHAFRLLEAGDASPRRPLPIRCPWRTTTPSAPSTNHSLPRTGTYNRTLKHLWRFTTCRPPPRPWHYAPQAKLTKIDYADNSIQHFEAKLPGMQFVAFNTNVPHVLAESDYGNRVRELRCALREIDDQQRRRTRFR